MELVLDVSRIADDAEVEAHTVAVVLDPTDLEDLLRADEGEEIGLQFDADELEAALADDEVEAHGLRQKAAVLAVAAVGVGAFAGHAAAQPTSDVGGRPAAAQGMTAKEIWATAPPAVKAQYAKQDAARAAKLRTPAPFHPATGGGGIEFSAPSSSEAAALAGGVALLITGASFAARGHHRRPVKPA
jgi:hypothetical protein